VTKYDAAALCTTSLRRATPMQPTSKDTMCDENVFKRSTSEEAKSEETKSEEAKSEEAKSEEAKSEEANQQKNATTRTSPQERQQKKDNETRTD
jgi:hypothetical protein